jgi:hypothetical protein
MKCILFIASIILLLAAGTTHAYHVGEKPKKRAENANAPKITRLTSGMVEFTTGDDAPVVVRVTDVMGRYIPINGELSITVYPHGGHGSARIAFEEVPSGMYFIALSNPHGTTVLGVAELR